MELTVPERCPWCGADWVHLERLFINLVKNAMEAMVDVAESIFKITARQTEHRVSWPWISGIPGQEFRRQD